MELEKRIPLAVGRIAAQDPLLKGVKPRLPRKFGEVSPSCMYLRTRRGDSIKRRYIAAG